MPEPTSPAADPEKPADSEAIRIGQAIKGYRKAYGLSARQLGELIGCTDRNIRLIEAGNGGKVPEIDLLARIAGALKLPLAALVVRGYDQLTGAKVA